MKTRVAILAASIIGGMMLSGATVSDVTARQRWPWNGLVDIDYTITGEDTEDTAISVSVTDTDTGKIYTPTNFLEVPPTIAGRHRITWSTEADGLDLIASNVTVTVSLEETLFLVINLSGGSNAASWPVSSLTAVPEDGWTDEYKASKLVLRRIDGPNGVYYAGVFEITEAQWDKVMGGTSTSTKPKTYVSYNDIRGDASVYDWPTSDAVDATSFIGKLRQKTGLATLDLPSLAEWEFAARAGVTTRWLCGDTEWDLAKYAWYTPNSGSKSHPVGELLPNAWGLYDVHGNIREWCLDRYSSESSSRRFRGGTFRSVASACAFDYRDGYGNPSVGWDNEGFRLACRPGSN